MKITDDMVTAALAAWNRTPGPDRDAMRAALEEALMSEADKLDKKYWAAAKADFQAKTLNVAGSPTWEELTDKQRNVLRWLAQRRAERKELKDATFYARYGTNAEVRAAGEARLLAFDKETEEQQPGPEYPFRVVGVDEAAVQDRIDYARFDAALAVQQWRDAYPEAAKVLDGHTITADEVRMTPRSRAFKDLAAQQPEPGIASWDNPADDPKPFVAANGNRFTAEQAKLITEPLRYDPEEAPDA